MKFTEEQCRKFAEALYGFGKHDSLQEIVEWIAANVPPEDISNEWISKERVIAEIMFYAKELGTDEVFVSPLLDYIREIK